jgi:hypothetical protein
MLFRAPLLLLIAASLLGCGSISITGDSIDGFSPASQVWLRKGADGATTHEFILSSVSDYCRLKRTAEQERIEAQARYQGRVEAGDPECESFDLLVDDLRDAYQNLEKNGAKQLRLVLARADVGETPEALTAPTVGRYAQVGGGAIGTFDAQLHYWEDDYWSTYADAYACVDPENLDQEALTAFLTEVSPSAIQVFPVSAGEVELAGGEDGAWEITMTGDLLRGGTDTVGSLTAEFTTEQCEISVVDAPL